MAPSRGGLIDEERGKIAEPDVSVKYNENDWDLEGNMVSMDVKASILQNKMRELQRKCHTASVETPADSLAVVALAGQCLALERLEAKRKQTQAEL